MPKKLVIFDIPLIVDLIASYLPIKDIKTCRKACRGWNSLFSPHMWREIRIVDMSRKPPESIHALSRNARFIHRLQVDLLVDASLLIDAQCNRLQELVCLWDQNRAKELQDNHYAQMLQDGDVEMFDVSSTPMQLIAMNPGLSKLEIACNEKELGVYLDEPVLASIARCQRLAHLSLHVTGTLNSGILQKMLNTIPRTCQFFELSLKNILRMATQVPSSRLVFEPSFHLPFRTIRFLGELYSFEQSTLMPILKHSPEMTKVLLPIIYRHVVPETTSTLLSHCKHIAVLHVPADVEWQPVTWREPEILDLIRGYQLQEFSMDTTRLYDENIIRALVYSSANSLRVVVIDNATVDVEPFLRECPELRRLIVCRPCEPHNPNGISLATLVTIPWASPHLETLNIPVVGGSWSGWVGIEGRRAYREGGLSQEYQEAQWILQLYWKLKSLRNLQNFEIEWCSTKDLALNPRVMFPLSPVMKLFLLQSGMSDASMRWMSLYQER
ncbi:hypothetical protein BGZ81_005303 [Podila clonocystis]|nr:hypothetical protein BGZ81_005303 [Podila clonocystis]